jgi:hypothetical protein
MKEGREKLSGQALESASRIKTLGTEAMRHTISGCKIQNDTYLLEISDFQSRRNGYSGPEIAER